MSRRALIIGAGPAGLTAACELLERTDIVPIVLEQDTQVGGLAKTVVYRGNRMDIGGHRFFTKSERVLQWWLELLPLQALPEGEFPLQYRGHASALAGGAGPDPETEDKVMLLCRRVSRIYFDGQLFDYPLRPTAATLRKLGYARAARFGLSYLRRRLQPMRPEENLEQFFINRFGDAMYRTFFEGYTEKVWGVPCREISASWGAQRVKSLSIGTALRQALRPGKGTDLQQRDTPTSLIEYFLYPKLGPGQMWEEAARRVQERGGAVHCGWRVTRIARDGQHVRSVEAEHIATGERRTFEADVVLSSMPVSALATALDAVPESLRTIAAALPYRDFITIGLLVRRMDLEGGRMPDSWLYIQDPQVRLGRVQFYNNWSRSMVADADRVWLGLEYFCNSGDDLWEMDDTKLIQFAAAELAKIGLVQEADVLDGTVLRMEKAYPAYHGAYAEFDQLREYFDSIDNLYLIGRNGMHKYNNQDHSMLTAMAAVEAIATGRTDKAAIWAVNTGEEYLEEG
jgi:protoporphyrinogen oxidase